MQQIYSSYYVSNTINVTDQVEGQTCVMLSQYDFQTFKLENSVNFSNNYNTVFIELSAKGAN